MSVFFHVPTGRGEVSWRRDERGQLEKATTCRLQTAASCAVEPWDFHAEGARVVRLVGRAMEGAGAAALKEGVEAAGARSGRT
jgi:hypothetical protein